MPDDRPLIEKLQRMAEQTVSPDEAEIAREMIKRMLGLDQGTPSKERLDDTFDGRRPLTRDMILGTPDRDVIGGTVRMQTKSGTWYTIDIDEMSINIEPVVAGVEDL